MAIHCAADEHGGLIKNIKKKSSWVKLKVVVVVWRLNVPLDTL